MNVEIDFFEELHSLNICAIPLLWDEEKMVAAKHPEHGTGTATGRPTMDDVRAWMANGFATPNGVAIKIYPPLAFLDFDLKNTDHQGIFDEFFQELKFGAPDLLRKICVETTRSKGFHLWFKSNHVNYKKVLAKRDGKEVIAIYTGSVLGYCDPTPGYRLFHNNFNDLELLSDEEYETLISIAFKYNEDPDFTVGSSENKPIEYPKEYESLFLQFDELCTDDVFETMINEIGLFRVKEMRQFRNAKYVPFLRKGSTGAYSAKVYFRAKRMFLFSASVAGFPNWHDRLNEEDDTWRLSPSRILYYKNQKNWKVTVEEMIAISESAGLGLEIGSPPEEPKKEEELYFPYEIFPEDVMRFIKVHRIQHEYVAGAVLVALSSAIGNSVQLEASAGYKVRPVIYMGLVASAGAGKTPAMKVSFSPIEYTDQQDFISYKLKLKEYESALARYKKDKNAPIDDLPKTPIMRQILIKDSTIESVVKILSFNPEGCCLYADELSGFMKRMNQYKAGDEVQKWLEMWSGGSILLQRVTREENKVLDPFCNIIGGIQPGLLELLGKEENEHNGFFHRFLFVYPEMQPKPDWEQLTIPEEVNTGYIRIVNYMLELRDRVAERGKVTYRLTREANDMYKTWFNKKNRKYDRSTNDHAKGIISKYQEYCLRLALILQVLYDGTTRDEPYVSPLAMSNAIRLTEYFLANMRKAIKLLAPESPADRLQGKYAELYNKLPTAFSTATAIEEARKLRISDTSAKKFLQSNKNKLFENKDRGKYFKIY